MIILTDDWRRQKERWHFQEWFDELKKGVEKVHSEAHLQSLNQILIPADSFPEKSDWPFFTWIAGLIIAVGVGLFWGWLIWGCK